MSHDFATLRSALLPEVAGHSVPDGKSESDLVEQFLGATDLGVSTRGPNKGQPVHSPDSLLKQFQVWLNKNF